MTLEQRIAATLANPNMGAEELQELIRETETAARASEQAPVEERVRAVDLTLSPDAAKAHQRVVDAEISRDRLNTVLPKLRAKLAIALAREAKARWLADSKRVEEKLNEAVTIFNCYQEHAEAIAHIFAVAAEVDKEVDRLNITAPDGIDYRLRSVELTARTLTQFTRDNPSFATTVVLPLWDHSSRMLWPPSRSLAASYAEMTTTPYHPGARWGEPDVQKQRRTDIEKDQAQSAAFHEEAQAAEEERINRQERERFSRRPT